MTVSTPVELANAGSATATASTGSSISPTAGATLIATVSGGAASGVGMDFSSTTLGGTLSATWQAVTDAVALDTNASESMGAKMWWCHADDHSGSGTVTATVGNASVSSITVVEIDSTDPLTLLDGGNGDGGGTTVDASYTTTDVEVAVYWSGIVIGQNRNWTALSGAVELSETHANNIDWSHGYDIASPPISPIGATVNNGEEAQCCVVAGFKESSGQAIAGATTTQMGVTFPTGVLTPGTAAIAGATTTTMGVTFPTGVLTPATAAIAGATTTTMGVTFPTGVLAPGVAAIAGATTTQMGVTFPTGVLTPGTAQLAGATTTQMGVTFPLGVLTSGTATQEIDGATTTQIGVTFPTGVLTPGTAALAGATTTQMGVTFPQGVLAIGTSAIEGATTTQMGVTFPTGTLTPGTAALVGATTATIGVTFPTGVLTDLTTLEIDGATTTQIGVAFPTGVLANAAGALYTYLPPTRSELREYRGAGQRYFLNMRARPSLGRGVAVLFDGATYSTSEYPSVDDLSSASAYYLGGHEYEVDEATKTAIEASGVGGTFEAV